MREMKLKDCWLSVSSANIVFVGQQLIVQLDLSSSWTFGVKWSPSGNTLAYVGKKILSSGCLPSASLRSWLQVRSFW